MPLLTLLVLIPAIGSLVVALVGRGRATLTFALSVGFSIATLGLSGWLLWLVASSGPTPSEVHAWISALGASVSLGAAVLPLVLAVWVALASVLTVVAARPDARVASVVLLLEAAAVALFLARDVFFAFASLGTGSIAIALLSSKPRNVLIAQSVGFAILFGWFATLYRMVYQQTGFVSTELTRWQGLVLYPGEARSLFILGGFAVVWLMLASSLAMDSSSRAGRLMLSATALPMSSYFVLGVLVPLSRSGAESVGRPVVALAALLMVSTFFARGWSWMVLGFQGLVLFGLFTFHEDATNRAVLMMIAASAGFVGIELTHRKNVVWVFVLLLIGLPLAFVLPPAWLDDRFVAAIGTVSFVVMTYRLVALGKRVTERTG